MTLMGLSARVLVVGGLSAPLLCAVCHADSDDLLAPPPAPVDSRASLVQAEDTHPPDSVNFRWVDWEPETPVLQIAEQSLTDTPSELAVMGGQLDVYPFGSDTVFLTAGAVALSEQDLESWTRTTALPGTPLDVHSEDVDIDPQHVRWARYFGAGVNVRDGENWSLTLQGGAYFKDEQGSIDSQTLQMDNLDRINSDAVGDRQARHVKPVGHLVMRWQF